MTKMLVFDMDGTITDLYGVQNWLNDLQTEKVRPYEIAEPLYNMEVLKATLELLKTLGWKIAITSWTAKGGSKEYNKAVAKAKKEWLDTFGFPYNELHFVKYGSTKANSTRGKADYQILIDDNMEVRNGWTLGATIDANENIIDILKQLADLF